MEYTIIVNGKSYDLPKKTLKVAEDMEKVVKIDASTAPIKDKYKAVLTFCQGLLGKEATAEILGGDRLEEIDLSEITLLFERIDDAYTKPVTDYQTEKSAEKLSGLPIAELEKLTAAMASIK